MRKSSCSDLHGACGANAHSSSAALYTGVKALTRSLPTSHPTSAGRLSQESFPSKGNGVWRYSFIQAQACWRGTAYMPVKDVSKPSTAKADLPVSDVIIRYSIHCYTILLGCFSHKLPERQGKTARNEKGICTCFAPKRNANMVQSG